MSTVVMIAFLIAFVSYIGLILYFDNRDSETKANLEKALADSEVMKLKYETRLKELELKLAGINKNKESA